MTKRWNTLQVTGSYKKTLDEMVEWYKRNFDSLPETSKAKTDTTRAPVRFIMHEPYSTYCLKKYASSEYDLDGDVRTGQYYAVMVDGDARIPVSLFEYDPNGNSKQMIEFRGDTINGSIKLVLGEHATESISLLSQDLTESYLVEKLEALPNIGKGNVSASVWPGQWLIEFDGQLAGTYPDLFQVDLPEGAIFDCWAYFTDWKDSRIDDEILFPIPMVGVFDADDDGVNDAVAAGSIGMAAQVPGVGLVVYPAQCRDFNNDGTPDLG